ncbi:DUF692 domain-containing protein [Antrihabitans sp. YC2-6]|uniref:DUF692 domain-containing protein n=1 Tax=Antrihabitans sp. YC2-6 TaxID=2799498 RepID=UPI0018F432D5|nr:DUF692 domain-containing protein [Antrihabitans sp. YC2-6]MBJ8347674.1 DUF692 domain-containing protein [Antrihabitans sp. YC2-6]
MTSPLADRGLGIGWRPEIAHIVADLDIGFCEVIAESLVDGVVPDDLAALLTRGVAVVPHGISLSLGGAEPLDLDRVEHLAVCAEALGAPLVSEHIAFVRADGIEAGHLLPIPRTAEALDVVCRNIELAQERLPVPLAVENIAALFDWPDAEFTEASFLRELTDRTGVYLLLDVANIYANARNRGLDPAAELAKMPLDRIAYCHIAGGSEFEGLYHDTHTDPVPAPVLELVTQLRSAAAAPMMLERDGNYPPVRELHAELDAIARAAGFGSVVR